MAIGISTRELVLPLFIFDLPDEHRPTLKTAPVFGGIAGIAAVEQGDHEDSNRKKPADRLNGSNSPLNYSYLYH
jgi:hypothetical protein